MDLDVLTEAIDLLNESDPAASADPESIQIVQRQLARLDAFVTRATAAFDTSRNWAPDGARNAATWLVVQCHLPKGQARRTVRRGRLLRDMPAATQAWAGATSPQPR